MPVNLPVDPVTSSASFDALLAATMTISVSGPASDTQALAVGGSFSSAVDRRSNLRASFALQCVPLPPALLLLAPALLLLARRRG